MQLFDDEWGENNDPIEDVDITTTILYFSVEQLAEFKKLARNGIKKMFGQEFQQKGNLADFILELCRIYSTGEIVTGNAWKEPAASIEQKVADYTDNHVNDFLNEPF